MNNKKTIISLAAVIAVAAAIFGIATASKKTDAIATVPDTTTPSPAGSTDTANAGTTAPDTTTTTPVVDKPAPAPHQTSTYKDGTYSATGSYKSPGGPDEIGVKVTLKDDIITAVSITPMPHDPTSRRYQQLFASGYQSLVLGKDISSVHLDAVSGSSLTPIGFNAAITQIKAQAKA